MTTKIRTLKLEYDVVKIHYNARLKNKPYLVRVFSYGGPDPEELRLDKKDVDNLYKTLKENNLL